MSINSTVHDLYRKVFKTIELPELFTSITRIDTESEVSPLDAGLSHQSVDEMWATVRDFFRAGVHPGLAICLRRHGKIVLNRTLGYANYDEQTGASTVLELDTPICLFSASKAISAVLVHKLAEQGGLNLLDPVSYYIPKFAAKGKGSINIYQLLSHRAGVPNLLEDTGAEQLFDREKLIEAICHAEPKDIEGRSMAYHAVTSGFIIDELIRVITGKDIQQYLHETIREPMGMQYFRYGLEADQMPLAAKNYVTGLPNGPVVGGMLKKVFGLNVADAIELTNSERFYQAVIPSANIFATAEETCRFFQMLLNQGEWNGKQLLNTLTVHRATREVGPAQIDKSLMIPMRYSAGMMLGGNPVGIYGRNCHYAYGHLGFANIFCWADPERDLACSILTTGKPIIGPHLYALLNMMRVISEECKPVVDMVGDEPIFQRKNRKQLEVVSG